ncbi:hypothetical protein AAFF_G00036300 [Aldrovandia affinis]|uniref:Kazal-like domain-containing protein n=1 Tax=Aldrovandia affinis TaxID=143900 RepID=A0AAD7WGJ6_9TELE|nr:hypothetical protein AAFF_G00036300 [Aldrovandia affinis]
MSFHGGCNPPSPCVICLTTPALLVAPAAPLFTRRESKVYAVSGVESGDHASSRRAVDGDVTPVSSVPPAALKDPCSDVTCSYGSTCAQSSDGQSAKCMCPLSCEAQPELVVCGSDGQDYRNECELNKRACDLQRNVRKRHLGPCDPCKDSQNNLNVACRVEPRTRRPLTFAPPEDCVPESEPLCASDGHTYDSECRMQRTGMLKGTGLRKIHSGRCKKQEECREECKFNAVCLVERLGPRCSCEPIECDGTYRPLCGKDGRTYANDCERQRAECQAKAHIPVKQQGPCGPAMSYLLSLMELRLAWKRRRRFGQSVGLSAGPPEFNSGLPVSDTTAKSDVEGMTDDRHVGRWRGVLSRRPDVFWADSFIRRETPRRTRQAPRRVTQIERDVAFEVLETAGPDRGGFRGPQMAECGPARLLLGLGAD